MTKLLLLGGTGYAGTFIAQQAQNRNHQVTVLSRSQPTSPIEGVTYIQGSAEDDDILASTLNDIEVIVATVSPRGNMAGKVAPLYAKIAEQAAARNIRFIVVGGFSSLRPAPGAPRFFEDGSIPPEYRDEALELAGVFDALKDSAPENLDWVFISPAAAFGSYVDVADTGAYQLGGDVAVFDKKGESKISGADFAIGVVDETENKLHRAENISLTQ